VLDRAGRLTPGALRAAIARAVMEVAPEKAKKRREAAARDARVERWAEDSGNAALAGHELPPDVVLAADQRITAWARELKKSGLEGDMDVLRAWLRPARTQEPQETRRTRRARWAGIRIRARRRTWDLATSHPRRRPGPAGIPRSGHHAGLRSPVRGQRSRSRGQAPSPDPGPARDLHGTGLPATSRTMRLRAQHPVRGGRADVPVQRRPEVSA
jgi:hypothetical protein